MKDMRQCVRSILCKCARNHIKEAGRLFDVWIRLTYEQLIAGPDAEMQLAKYAYEEGHCI
jgi:hypothetical protein